MTWAWETSTKFVKPYNQIVAPMSKPICIIVCIWHPISVLHNLWHSWQLFNSSWTIRLFSFLHIRCNSNKWFAVDFSGGFAHSVKQLVDENNDFVGNCWTVKYHCCIYYFATAQQFGLQAVHTLVLLIWLAADDKYYICPTLETANYFVVYNYSKVVANSPKQLNSVTCWVRDVSCLPGLIAWQIWLNKLFRFFKNTNYLSIFDKLNLVWTTHVVLFIFKA